MLNFIAKIKDVNRQARRWVDLKQHAPASHFQFGKEKNHKTTSGIKVWLMWKTGKYMYGYLKLWLWCLYL